MTRAAPIAVVASLFAASLSLAGSPPPWTQQRHQSRASQEAQTTDSRDVSPSSRDNGRRNWGDNSRGRESDQARRGDSEARGNGGWNGRDATHLGRPPTVTEPPRQPPANDNRSRDGDRGNWQGDRGRDWSRDQSRNWDHDHNRDWDREHLRDGERDRNRDGDRGRNRDWDRDHNRNWDGDRDWDRDHNRNWDGDRDWDRDHWRDNRGRDWNHDRNWYSRYRGSHFRYYGGHYYAVNRFSIGIYYSPFSYYRPRFWLSDGYLPGAYYESRYYIGDYWSYDLYDPPIGCRWVRVGSDALLVDTWTGEVIDQVYDLFW